MDNKVICITGANTGIGKETAFQFARAGGKIAIAYVRDVDAAQTVAERCTVLGAKDVLIVPLDITSDEQIREAVKIIINRFGKIDMLINNAGVVVWKFLAEQSGAEIESQLRVNLEGLIKMTKECLPYVTETIINIASTAGLRAHENATVYCASKFGVRGFTQALAHELPDKKVFAVNPGPTATEMTNYEGVAPEQVAEIIFKTAKGEYAKESGSDINVSDYL